MATVTKSAADSAAKLFGSVAVTADVITTAVNAVGSSFEVLDLKAKAWVKETREDITNNETIRSVVSKANAAKAMVEHIESIEKFLQGNPSRQAAYDKAVAAIEAAHKPAS